MDFVLARALQSRRTPVGLGSVSPRVINGRCWCRGASLAKGLPRSLWLSQRFQTRSPERQPGVLGHHVTTSSQPYGMFLQFSLAVLASETETKGQLRRRTPACFILQSVLTREINELMSFAPHRRNQGKAIDVPDVWS